MLSKHDKEKIIKEFQLHPNDTGSVEVRIAVLTHEIQGLTEHFKKYPKDTSSKRGLTNKVSQRRSLLLYLAQQDVAKYKDVTSRLGMRK